MENWIKNIQEPYIKKIESPEHGRIKVDDRIYSVPQWVINHIRLHELANENLKKENAELNELRANYLETLILRDKEIYCLKQTVSQRNIQIADLKHRLNGQPITSNA